MKKNQNARKDDMNTQALVGAGLAVGALAAAAAGTYFLYGSKNAKKNRAHVRSWAYKAKSEVLENLHALQEVSETEYKKLIDSVLSNYQNVDDITVQEVAQVAKDLKDQWKHIRNELKKTSKSGAKKKAAPQKKSIAKKTGKAGGEK